MREKIYGIFTIPATASCWPGSICRVSTGRCSCFLLAGGWVTGQRVIWSGESRIESARYIRAFGAAAVLECSSQHLAIRTQPLNRNPVDGWEWSKLATRLHLCIL